MIFNESNVKVIRENGYLTKYAGKKAPYFPFTEDDVKNNLIVLFDETYDGGRYFYQNVITGKTVYFTAIVPSGARRLSFDFTSMVILSSDYNWGGN